MMQSEKPAQTAVSACLPYLLDDHLLKKVLLVEEHKNGCLLENGVARHFREQLERLLHPVDRAVLEQNLL